MSTLYGNGATILPANQKIDQLTEMMQSLTLLVRTFQTHVGQASLSKIPLSISLPAPTGLQRSRSGASFLEERDKCHYCWKIDHYLKRDCGMFQDDLNSKRIHFGDDRKICPETYTPGAKSRSGASFLEEKDKCHYCWETDHYLKRDCGVFQDDLNSKQIHFGDDKKICLGTYTPGAKPIVMRHEKSRRD